MYAMTLESTSSMGLAERLTRLRERKDWNLTDLAQASGVSLSTVSRIEAGKILSPGADVMLKLAGALGVTTDDLMGETDPTPHLIIRKDVVLVPYVRRSAHAGDDPWRETTEDRAPLNRDEAHGHRRLYAARVAGTCMVPDVAPGATVIWDPDMRHPADGQMVVVSVNGDLMVKLAYRDDDGGYLLVSHDGQEVRPNGLILEGVVVKVTNDPRRGPRSLAEFRRERDARLGRES